MGQKLRPTHEPLKLVFEYHCSRRLARLPGGKSDRVKTSGLMMNGFSDTGNWASLGKQAGNPELSTTQYMWMSLRLDLSNPPARPSTRPTISLIYKFMVWLLTNFPAVMCPKRCSPAVFRPDAAVCRSAVNAPGSHNGVARPPIALGNSTDLKGPRQKVWPSKYLPNKKWFAEVIYQFESIKELLGFLIH